MRMNNIHCPQCGSTTLLVRCFSTAKGWELHCGGGHEWAPVPATELAIETGRQAEEIEAMKARAAALADAARTLVVALGCLPGGQRAKVAGEVYTLLAEVDGISPDAREHVVISRETARRAEHMEDVMARIPGDALEQALREARQQP